MHICRWHLIACIFILIGILVWFDQYRLGFDFLISDLFDNRIHHEKITVVAFIIAASIFVLEFTSRHRQPHNR